MGQPSLVHQSLVYLPSYFLFKLSYSIRNKYYSKLEKNLGYEYVYYTPQARVNAARKLVPEMDASLTKRTSSYDDNCVRNDVLTLDMTGLRWRQTITLTSTRLK